MLHAKIFRDIFRSDEKTPLTQREIAERAGMKEAYLSAFLLGKKDIKSSTFLHLVSSMPDDFKIKYYRALAELLKIDKEDQSKKKLQKQRSKVEI